MKTMFLGRIPKTRVLQCMPLGDDVSDRSRFRINPICAVSQKSQPMAQPTWLETQSVCVSEPSRLGMGISTDLGFKSILALQLKRELGGRTFDLFAGPTGQNGRLHPLPLEAQAPSRKNARYVESAKGRVIPNRPCSPAAARNSLELIPEGVNSRGWSVGVIHGAAGKGSTARGSFVAGIPLRDYHCADPPSTAWNGVFKSNAPETRAMRTTARRSCP